MTITVANTSLTNTYDYWRQRTNEIADALTNKAVTTESNTATGNAAITGTFTANGFVGTFMSVNGSYGNIAASYITVANIATINVSIITTANITTANIITLGANAGVINTVNIGTTNITTLANVASLKISNSTVTYTVPIPSTSQQTNNYVFLCANGNWGVPIPFPAGSDTQVQFNDNGTSNGDSGFTYAKTTQVLTVGNTISVPALSGLTSLDLGNSAVRSFSTTTTGTSTVNLDSFSLSSYRSAEYLISLKDTSANNYQTSKILMMHDGTTAYLTEYGMMISNSQVATFSATANSTYAALQITPVSATTTVRVHRTAIGV